MESNKLLREEKEKIEQDLQQAQSKVSVYKHTLSVLHTRTSIFERAKGFDTFFGWFQLQKMESDILPLQQSNSELSEKSGMLQAEKKILEDEIKRWKARTQVSGEKSSQGWNYDVDASIWWNYLQQLIVP